MKAAFALDCIPLRLIQSQSSAFHNFARLHHRKWLHACHGFCGLRSFFTSQNQRQAFVKHSSDRSCELLSEDHLLNSQSSRKLLAKHTILDA
jgi:hypothetical protein